MRGFFSSPLLDSNSRFSFFGCLEFRLLHKVAEKSYNTVEGKNRLGVNTFSIFTLDHETGGQSSSWLELCCTFFLSERALAL